MNWDLHGTDRRLIFEGQLEPDKLARELQRYQKVFGKEFKLQDLLQLEEIRSQALVAQAINDAPEFLLDQVGKMRNSHEVDTIATSLRYISDSLDRIADQ